MKNSNSIFSKKDLIKLFKRLGLNKGDNVMVHSSMKTLGTIVNGAIDVIESLIETVGKKKGTILMPSHSGQMTDPIFWKNPPIPKKHIYIYKKNMKPFNKRLTPVRNRGIIPSTFMYYPMVFRSNHPLNSVCAFGKKARKFTSSHNLHESEGKNSPIGKLYNDNGKILLLGVGLKHCTAIHLAEFISNVKYLYINNPVVLKKRVNNINYFEVLKKYPSTSEYFDKLMPIFKKNKFINEIKFGNAVVRLIKIKPAVDCVIEILKVNPKYLITK